MTIKANNPKLKSWVEVPAGSDFPIQNLPFGIFKTEYLSPVAGVAIGDHVLDLVYLHENGFLDGLGLPVGIFNQRYLNDFIGLGKKKTREVREQISELLQHDNDELKSNLAAREIALIPMSEVEMQLPIRIPNYTDFYSSEEHATNVGTMFRDPKNALLPNWKHLPVGYHGRASSIVVSGTDIHRPKGQVKPIDSEIPLFCPSQKVDFELEMAFITCTDTKLGSSIATKDAEDHIFGFVLFNDWSARDIQNWEYVPLGPFLGKNFGSTISPWIVTLDALQPFRVKGPDQFPQVLPYLVTNGEKNFDISLEVLIKPEQSDETTVSRSNFKFMYWNVNQQLAHHTVNGCNLQVGDLYASGTISGPSPGSFGSMLELTWNGQRPMHLADGTERKFINDGDTVVLRGHAEKDGVRIGFGECKGKILPAL
ncbi:MAG: fumarylacetoacetase [Cytophagales bacterium]|jgi:fumarylacetoacetase|nr:fumarylacetoacetase [Cytophagales bacterium]MCA6388082.1 fumarylacetoacetase [Cytophagales bacterium]MCA6391925.1 fumarylacetoacetase [Cytophagales bacterium]MCA6396594.1 fumarylacetoacetase [Cytophagales bacterium]MCA6399024.1 fumarylacetoacetase [Cytophagales bacterium]